MAQDKSHLTVYKPQQFVKERQLNVRYGNNPSRKELKRFNRYWNSEQRQIDEHTHYMSELNKMFDSVQRNMDYLRTKYRPRPLTPIQSTPRTPSTPSTPSVPSTPSTSSTTTTSEVVSIPYWEEVAKQNGFNSMQEVAEWQAKHGLVADGKFGNRSRAKKAALESGSASGSGNTDSTPKKNEVTLEPAPAPAPTQSSTSANGAALSVTSPGSGGGLSSPAYTIDQLWNSHLFKSYAGENRIAMTSGTDRTRIMVDGKEYPVVITQGFANNETGILPYRFYAYDPATGLIKRLETSLGTPYSTRKHSSKNGSLPIEGGQFAPGAKWRNPQKLFDIYPTQEAASASLQF